MCVLFIGGVCVGSLCVHTVYLRCLCLIPCTLYFLCVVYLRCLCFVPCTLYFLCEVYLRCLFFDTLIIFFLRVYSIFLVGNLAMGNSSQFCEDFVPYYKHRVYLRCLFLVPCLSVFVLFLYFLPSPFFSFFFFVLPSFLPSPFLI